MLRLKVLHTLQLLPFCIYFISFLILFYPLFRSNIFAVDLNFTPNPNLDYVAIENKDAVINENGFVNVKLQEAVKIAGKGEPNTTAIVSFSDKVYETVIDDTGNWFVVFTIQDIEKGSYPVELKLSNQRDSSILFILDIEEGDITTTENNKGTDDSSKTSILPYILLFLFLPVSFVLGWFLNTSYHKKKR